ncbi:MAG TPA: molybdopterin-dependent oxidoreductase [Rhodanobacteraceae bacterium]|nr:molybdopterin-dependent oxidoreductase [Rhodanobacteraceae bacterium]
MHFRSALLLALLLPLISSVAAHEKAATDQPSFAVTVHGAVVAPRSFDVADLKQLAAHDSGPIDVVCASGATVGTVKNFRGVRLTDVIDATGLKLEGHKDARTLVVVARATDGYVVTFSWNELYNTTIGKDVLVAWEKDGKPLGPHEGQLLLISGQDIKTGPRHVRNLADIRIERMK